MYYIRLKEGDNYILKRLVICILQIVLQWSNDEEMGVSCRTHDLIDQNWRKETTCET